MTPAIEQEMIATLPRLRRFCLGLTGTRDAADDLAQSTCERAISRIHLWQTGSRIDSWMFAIAKRVWINEWHKKRRRGTEIDFDTAGDAEAAQSIGNAESTIQLKQAVQALDHLPDEQRELLLLVCVEGFSYKEAAACMDMPIGTVMSKLARGRQKLRTLLEEQESTSTSFGHTSGNTGSA